MVTLRAPRLEDPVVLFPLLMDTGVPDTLLWDGPVSLESYSETWARTCEAVARGERHAFVVVDAASGAPIGSSNVRAIDGVGAPPPFRGEIGLWIGVPHQGRGAGTAAIRKLVEYGFGTLGLQKIEANVFVGNEASRRAFEKAGFTLEGTIRRAVRKRGQLVDEWLFGIVPEDVR